MDAAFYAVPSPPHQPGSAVKRTSSAVSEVSTRKPGAKKIRRDPTAPGNMIRSPGRPKGVKETSPRKPSTYRADSVKARMCLAGLYEDKNYPEYRRMEVQSSPVGTLAEDVRSCRLLS